MILDTHKVIFIDITKTGGSSICKVLAQYGGRGKHHSISRQLPDLPVNKGLVSPLPEKLLSDYFIFTVVRNPWDRFISLYSYCMTAPLQEKFRNHSWDGIMWALSAKPGFGADRDNYWPTDIRVFVEWMLEHERYYTDFTGEKYIPMIDWLKLATGAVVVDHIARYESLQADFDVIADKIKIPKTLLPHINESLNEHKVKAATAIKNSTFLHNCIREYFREDFCAFEYSENFEDCNAYKLLQLP